MQQSGGRDERGGPDETRELDRTQVIPGAGGAGAAAGPMVGGRYRLEGLLGAGGVAEVHRATDLRLNRPVAVKIFRSEADPDGERRFHSEAQLLANLNHPGLVAVYDSGVERRPYLVTELVSGWTLREVTDAERLPLPEIARIGADLADVLAYLHAEGAVHRDVRPSNVLVGRDNRVRLADFGVSRLGSQMTTRTPAAGSYLSPEERHGDWVGPPADVYSLGLVLLEAVTGRVPHPDAEPGVPDDVPAPMRRALLAMTELDPGRRPTAAQAVTMLAGSADEEAVEYEQPRRGVGRYVAIALGIIALVALLAAVAVAANDDEPTAAGPTAAPTATEDPGGDSGTEDPGGDSGTEDPGTEDPGAGDGLNLPDPPDFDVPELPDASDLPDLPEAPELPDSILQDAQDLWERFKDWVNSWL